ncbi:hypothetical protein [Streptomyces sp. NPDC051016]|uniref:hypothetical protein n=1 Tax=Streptomyces sp. NPDC051016 TaxID=3365638 RepID=UPI0037AA50E6
MNVEMALPAEVPTSPISDLSSAEMTDVAYMARFTSKPHVAISSVPVAPFGDSHAHRTRRMNVSQGCQCLRRESGVGIPLCCSTLRAPLGRSVNRRCSRQPP